MEIVARFLPVMSVATAIVAFAVVGLSQASSPFAAPGTAFVDPDEDGQADTTEPNGNAVDDATAGTALFVRVQLPSSVEPGSSRQVRIGVEERPVRAGMVERATPSEQMLAIEFDVVAGEGADGMIWIAPNRVLVHRRSVPWTRFDLTLRSDVPCGSDLGELQVRVRDLSDDTPTGETVVSLPPVRCVDPPTPAPTSVHDTETDCGGTVQEIRRVPRRAADGSTTCRLPRSRRPATPQPVVEHGTDAAVEDESDTPEDGSEMHDPDPSDATAGNDVTEGDEPSGQRDDPAPRPEDAGTERRDDAGTERRDDDEGSDGSSTTRSFEDRAGSP